MQIAVGRTYRQVLWSLFFWMPTLVLGFSVLFADVWLNTQMRANDYDLADKNQKIQDLSKQLYDLRMQAVEKEQDLARLDKIAEELGLVKPNPNQIVVMPDVARPEAVPPAAERAAAAEAAETAPTPAMPEEVPAATAAAPAPPPALDVPSVPDTSESPVLESDGVKPLDESLDELLEPF